MRRVATEGWTSRGVSLAGDGGQSLPHRYTDMGSRQDSADAHTATHTCASDSWDPKVKLEACKGSFLFVLMASFQVQTCLPLDLLSTCNRETPWCSHQGGFLTLA